MAVSPGREHEGILHIPTGQSGHPLSPHYGDQYRAWLNGEPTPFLPGAAVSTLTLTPRVPMNDLNRRDFLKLSGAAAAAWRVAAWHLSERSGAAQPVAGLLAAPPIELRPHRHRRRRPAGRQPRRELPQDSRLPHHRGLRHPRGAHRRGRSKAITAAGHPAPAVYTRGPRDFERLCETEDLDLVFTATPWEWHVPVMLAAMKNGKHAATEVPAAMTLDDCWALVEAAEKHQRHAVMMENCNYDRLEMMVLNMVRQGVFGEVLHAEGGYLHDLREIKFEKKDEGLWRRAWSTQARRQSVSRRTASGPIANCLDINRGDRFDYLVSMSGPSRGLQDWAREHFPADAPERSERFTLGDVNTSLIKTARGQHDHRAALHQPAAALQPHPHGAGHQGDVPGLSRIASTSKDAASRTSGSRRRDLRASSSIRCGRRSRRSAAGAGHGGMDFIEDYRLIKCLREGLPDRHERLRRRGAERGRRSQRAVHRDAAAARSTFRTSRAAAGARIRNCRSTRG